MLKRSIEKIAEEIGKAAPEDQRKLLTHLPHILKISLSDLGYLKLSENSFDFWNNPDDAVYDKL